MPDSRCSRTLSATERVWVVAAIAGTMWGQGVVLAFGSFSSSPTAPAMTVSSATLAAPTTVAAQNVNCVAATSTQVKITWTATSSAWADGYQVFRSLTSGGPYTAVGTQTGQSSTSFTDTGPLTFSTTYYYVVQSTKSSWRSANSNQATITTPTPLCA